ncbi:helix-turn-helix domain-containing protein [Streptomyces sp. NPDC047082]|uniref:MmyB family transcriptional regulator n=1 Tax=Streptomyces sp. NPDC047082 TaxID=3155259 RepID=UPI0033C3D33B
MVSARLADVVAHYRARASLNPKRVAALAGITEAQYQALESGMTWPGAAAVEAVIDVLQIPRSHRARLMLTDSSPLDKYLQRLLHGYDIPALIVDSTWRTVEANSFAHALLPDSARPGWNLLRWILLDHVAQKRLANWNQVVRAFARALHDGLIAAPDSAELLAIRESAKHLQSVTAPFSTGCPDGQVFVWRSDSGPYPISACLITIPSGRPDLLQLAFVPRSTQPGAALPGQHASPTRWCGPLLTDLLSCGLCGLLLTGGGEPTSYNCATGCLPELPAHPLELRIAEKVLSRAFSPQACRELGVAQEILAADGVEMALNVPVSPKHALHQWQHSMTSAQRRGILTTALRTATVCPAPTAAGSHTVELAYSWRELS